MTNIMDPNLSSKHTKEGGGRWERHGPLGRQPWSNEGELDPVMSSEK